MRDLIVVDVETTGLDPDYHLPIEVAAINMRTGEELYFVPLISPKALGQASGEALQINRYYERGVYKAMVPSGTETANYYDRLWQMLEGNTFGGSNPRFDARILCRGAAIPIGDPDMNNRPREEVWHHRLADVASYAAGTLALHPAKAPGLADLCQRLGISVDEPHSALGDARATAECFNRLMTTSPLPLDKP